MKVDLSELDGPEVVQETILDADYILKNSNLVYEQIKAPSGNGCYYVHELSVAAIRKMKAMEGEPDKVGTFVVISSLRDKPNGRLLFTEKDIPILEEALGYSALERIAETAIKLSGLGREQVAGN